MKKIQIPAAAQRESEEPAPSNFYGPGRRRGKAAYTINIDPADAPGEATAEDIENKKRSSGFATPNSGDGPE